MKAATCLCFSLAISSLQPLTAQEKPTPPALHRNAVINGDFSDADPGALPRGWVPKGADYQKNSVPWQNDAAIVQEGREKFLRFRRKASVRLANVAPAVAIPVPDRAKRAILSVKIRVENLVPANNYDRYPAATILARDADGKTPGPATAAATEDTRWRVFTATLDLQPGAKTVELSLGPCAAAGTCDFDDVSVKFDR